MPQKFGKVEARHGTTLYPGFSNTVQQLAGRLQRLEKGTQRQQRGSLRPTFQTSPSDKRRGIGGYTRIPSSILVQAGFGTAQKINLAHPNVRKAGGLPPQGVTGQFGYVATADGMSIIWYWDGTNSSVPMIIHRSDGTVLSVPTGGSGLQISGLSPSTDYYFLPFWNVNNGCNIGWVAGTTGSPQIAFVLADTTSTSTAAFTIQQTFQNLEPLSNGFMKATTTNGGGGTGGGGGGGGNGGKGCVMSGTDIDPVGGHDYKIEVLEETQWVHLALDDGRNLSCTLDHPLFHAMKGKIPASAFMVGDLIITDRGEYPVKVAYQFTKKCSKHKVHMAEGHLFWANGFLSHNFKLP